MSFGAAQATSKVKRVTDRPVEYSPVVVNVSDVSQIPALAEPWFLAGNATVGFIPAMTPEDLGKAGPSIEAAVKKALCPLRVVRSRRHCLAGLCGDIDQRWRPRGHLCRCHAETTVGAGLGANVLVRGSSKTIALQPVSMDRQIGLNLAAGFEELRLRFAP
jgi:Protein of unknown function (DUF992)